MRTGRVEYVEPLCGHAMRCLLSLLNGSEYDGILKSDIEVKAWSDKCLAKSVAVTWGVDTYF